MWHYILHISLRGYLYYMFAIHVRWCKLSPVCCIRNNYSENRKKLIENIETKPSYMMGLIFKQNWFLGEPKDNPLLLYGELCWYYIGTSPARLDPKA